MTNPIGTKEQRGEVLRWWPSLTANDVVIALRGLDIAEEMASALALHDPNCPALVGWDRWQGGPQ